MKKPSREELLKDVLSNMTWKEIATKYGYTDSRFLRKVANEYELPKRRKILKPSEKELREYIESGLNPYKIAEKLGYSKDGWRNIYHYLEEYKIEFNFDKHKDLREKEFSDMQKSLIYGTMLGDGYLRRGKGSKSTTLALGHSIKQLEYLEWKKSILKEFILAEKPYIRDNNGKAINKTQLCSYNTIAHGWLIDLRDNLYIDGVKTVTKEYLDNIDEFALAVWFFDDGSLNTNSNSYTLCTQSFSLEENQLIQKWFMDRYSLKCSIYEAKYKSGVKHYLWFNCPSSREISKMLKKFAPECMEYKTIQG